MHPRNARKKLSSDEIRVTDENFARSVQWSTPLKRKTEFRNKQLQRAFCMACK